MQRHDLLITVAENLIAVTPIDHPLFRGSEEQRDAHEQEELSWELEDRLTGIKPAMEPWDYLDEYIYPTLEAAFPDNLREVLLGSSQNDIDNSDSLLEAVKQTAEEVGFPEPPWFEVDDMVTFLRAWRESIVTRLEKRCGAAVSSP